MPSSKARRLRRAVAAAAKKSSEIEIASAERRASIAAAEGRLEDLDKAMLGRYRDLRIARKDVRLEAGVDEGKAFVRAHGGADDGRRRPKVIR